MQRRLEALDRRDAELTAAGIDPYDEWLRTRGLTDHGRPKGTRRARGPSRIGRRHRPWRSVIIVLVVIALPMAGVWAVGAIGGHGSTPISAEGTSASRPSPVVAGENGSETALDFPPPGHESRDAPLGTPAVPPAGPDTFAFIATRDASADPVTWDPCRPIHYATSGLAPEHGQEILASSFGRLAEITGFTFINDGPTSEAPALDRAPYQPDRYPDRWAPVLVAWTDAATIPDLAGSVIGLGGGIAVGRSSDSLTYVSGILYLDTPQIERDLSGRLSQSARTERVTSIRALMLHELGHLVGLGHVDDPAELMFPSTVHAVTDYGVGDLRGLFELAAGPCRPEL